MKKWQKIIIGFLVILAVAGVAFALFLSDKYVVPIMMYHSVGSDKQFPGNIVSTEMFAYHMRFLNKHGYNVISLDELVEATVNERKLPHNSVVITFDDGYEDNYTNAFPILKEYGFPATIFTATITIDTEGYLTPDQINEMYDYNITIGSHGLTQGYLPGLPREERLREIIESKRNLEKKFDRPIRYFSYPTGGFSDEIKDIVMNAGYKGATTTNRGYDRSNSDVYELKRIRFSDKDNSFWILKAKLSGFYNAFRSPRAPY